MWSFFSKDPAKDLNYELREVVSGLEDRSIWKLHKAKRKGTGEDFSVFAFDVKDGSEIQMELAKSCVKKLKTLRHPNILTYVDSVESEKIVYLVTEYVEPLETYLAASDVDADQKQLSIAWGLHQLVRALSFLNVDCGFAHHNVCLSSVFVNQAGEWKLGGYEYMGKGAEMGSPPIKILPQLEKYDPPEKSDASRLKSAKIWSADMWGLGCLIWEVFNGNFTKPYQLKSPEKIPKPLVPLYCELVGANPASRPSPAEFLSRCRVECAYLKNVFIDSLLFLEEIQIKDSSEKSKFFSHLPQHVDSFPKDICRYKILPQLISAFEFGGAGPTILAALFKLGNLMNEEEYQKKIVPCVVKMFSSTDRATRAKLLQQLEHFVDHLQPNIINSQVFPEIIHGFSDTNATIREVTVKSILHLAPKLNNTNLNVELMKHFARLQAKDSEGGIRTNTTVCLGKIAHHLHPETRKKVLVIAFTRAMTDPFPPARSAGILALAATQKFHSLEEVAHRILPALSRACIDPEKSVREQAFKAIKGFLGKLEKVSEDPSLREEIEQEINAASSTSTMDSALGWAGWAVTSLTSKLYKTSLGKPTSHNPTEAHAKPAAQIPASASEVPTEPLPSTDRIPPVGGMEVQNSDSDYDDGEGGWSESWGEMDSSTRNTTSEVSKNDFRGEGWDTGWGDADFIAVDHSGLNSTSSYNWEQKDNPRDNFLTEKPIMSTTSESLEAPESKTATKGWEGSWNDTNWEADSGSTAGVAKSQLGSKEERELKRLQRRKEMEEKRSQRQGISGPMKLGSRKKL